MLSLKRFLRMSALALALAATFSVAAGTPNAEAVDGMVHCTYYSDATRTTEVGGYSKGCGYEYYWGVSSPYRSCISEQPC